MFRKAKSNPTAERITHVAGLTNAKFVQNGDDVAGPERYVVGSHIVRLVAFSMPPGVNQDEAIGLLQGLDVTQLAPVPEAAGRPVLQH
jgi:hypothetical protein